jgi:hypothetical protein
MGEPLTKQYCLREEIKNILTLGNSWYHSVQSAIKKYEDQIGKTIILPFVLYGCETWCLTLWKEHWLRVCENRVQRKIYASKGDEVTGDWKRLHNE